MTIIRPHLRQITTTQATIRMTTAMPKAAITARAATTAKAETVTEAQGTAAEPAHEHR